MKSKYSLTWLLTIILAISLQIQAQSVLAAPELTIGNYQLVSSKRISRTVFEYTYKASISNTGIGAKSVVAKLNIKLPGVRVLDDSLEFGDVKAGATTSSKDSFLIRQDRQKALSVSSFLWEVNALYEPSDPQAINIGSDTNPITIDTLVYDGLVDIPLPQAKPINSLSVVAGLNEPASISTDGRFKARLNADTTGLLRVKDSDGNTILLQVFPKGEGLVKVNPVIDEMSTAVATIALMPGILTADPLLDVIILATIERIPETRLLANQIAKEISLGIFRLNGSFSNEVQIAIESVLSAAAKLTPEDIFASNSFDKFLFKANQFASKVISPAHADSSLSDQCADNFDDLFQGNSLNPDEVCIAASESIVGNPTKFTLWNRKTRFVFWSKYDSDFENLKTIGLVPPKHLDFGLGLVDSLYGTAKIISAGLVDTASMILNYKDYFQSGSKTDALLRESFEKRFGVSKANAEYVFQNPGEYSIATLGLAGSTVSNPKFMTYWSYSFGLTTVTEVAIPLISIAIDLGTRDLFQSSTASRIEPCMAKSEKLSLLFLDKAISLKIKSKSSGSNSEIATAFASFLVDDILLNEDVWTFGACISDNMSLYLSLKQGALEKLINETFGGPVTMVQKIASSTETFANLVSFLNVIFDDELAPVDYYSLSVANSNTPPNLTIKLNDTGVTTCSNFDFNGLACPVEGFPRQDAQYGRDAQALAGALNKVGGGEAGFDFTKLDGNGNSLPANASQWDCVKDNFTGLIWEVKTTSGLRSMNNTYSWYDPDNSKNGGNAGTQNGGICTGSSCDTDGYVQTVNSQGLCGASDWRMPDVNELSSIVHNAKASPIPNIDNGYFPNTPASAVWSSSPYAKDSNNSWYVDFSSGHVWYYSKFSNDHVRLVRGGE